MRGSMTGETVYHYDRHKSILTLGGDVPPREIRFIRHDTRGRELRSAKVYRYVLVEERGKRK